MFLSISHLSLSVDVSSTIFGTGHNGCFSDWTNACSCGSPMINSSHHSPLLHCAILLPMRSNCLFRKFCFTIKCALNLLAGQTIETRVIVCLLLLEAKERSNGVTTKIKKPRSRTKEQGNIRGEGLRERRREKELESGDEGTMEAKPRIV